MKMLYRIRVIGGNDIYENRAYTVYIGYDVQVEWVDYRGKEDGMAARVTITLKEKPRELYMDREGDLWIK